jgi:hypothetical protein
MKTALLIIFLFACNEIFAQTQDELKIQNLSATIFKWEVENKIDSLESILHEKFIAVSSNGSIQNKSQFTGRLRGGNFVHNKIDVEENKATVSDNTASLIGKGVFTVTVSGKNNIVHLSYIELFTRTNTNTPWKLLALKASTL